MTPTKPTTIEAAKLIVQLAAKVAEESQLIVHFSYKAVRWEEIIRIWQSTYLYAGDSLHRSELVYVENISLYPEWTTLVMGKPFHFTLVFTGLPKECKKFDLVEQIPEQGGFIFKNIRRNNEDIYHVKIKS